MTIFTSYIAFLCYLVGIAVLLRRSDASLSLVGNLALRVGGLACVFHASALALAFWVHQGLSNSFYDAISLTALIVTVTALITQRQHITRTVLLPIFVVSALCVLAAAHLGEHHAFNTETKGVAVHIISSIIAYALLCISALYAVLLWITDNRLRKHTLASSSLPPLQQTEQTLFYTLHSGWTALSCALLTGFLYIDDFIGQQLSHKVVFSMLSWLVFGILVVGHWKRGWRGKQAALWSIGGFMSLAVAFLGSKFVLDVVLDKL